MKKIYLWLLLPLLILGGCESLEDTYKDYAGDGPIRYLVKCDDLDVKAGWNRLVVSWKSVDDPIIDKVKVSWTVDGIGRDTLLERGTVACSLPCDGNFTYQVSVANMDKHGNTSLAVTQAGRPYSPEHEQVLIFPTMVNKHFYVQDRLALVLDEWGNQIDSIAFVYTSAGQGKRTVIKSAPESLYYLLEDKIDAETTLTVYSYGHLEGCVDAIVVSTELERARVYTDGFKALMLTRYGIAELTEEAVAGLETLEIDYDIDSFEDIMNMPGLKKLVLGKNRHLSEEVLGQDVSASKITDLEISKFAMEVMAELVSDFKVERYNKHYFPETYDFVEEKGNPVLPDLTYLNNETWTYECVVTPKEGEYYSQGYERLFDLNAKAWAPFAHYVSLEYEITVDMQEMKRVNGFAIEQVASDIATSPRERAFMARKVQVQFSVDGSVWTEAIDYTLGTTLGEIDLLSIAAPTNARYLKFVLTDQNYRNVYSISLQKIRIF